VFNIWKESAFGTAKRPISLPRNQKTKGKEELMKNEEKMKRR